MLGMLLTILKIIGIILLCILGLVVGILLIVLLVPIRYEAQGEIYEEYNIKVKVHWLFHLLHVVVQLQGKIIEVRVRILGIKLFSMKKEPEEESNSDEKSEESNGLEQGQAIEEDAKEASSEESKEKVNETVEETSDESLPEDGAASDNNSENVENTVEDTPESVLVDDRTFSEKLEDKIYKIVDTIAEKCESVEKTIEDLEDKIANIKRIVYHYLDLISHERTQNLLKRLLKEIGGIFVHIAPKKLKANLHIGMDNPATTGQICMYASMLYPIYKDNIQIEPDFEEKVLEGTFYGKGRIRLGHFVAMVIRCVVNRDFWYVLTHIKPKENEAKSRE